MSQLRHTDILVEMIELSHEIMDEIRQQLIYYRASVYKDETARSINQRIDQLRLVTGLFSDDMVQESLKDYDAMSKSGVMSYVPGECSFSHRVSSLMQGLSQHLERLNQQIVSRSFSPQNDADFTKIIRKHRTQLLGLCRHGSRQWAFFQAI